jgi:hypothetical protein
MTDIPETLVTVYGYVYTPSGAPVVNTKIVYSILNRPKEYAALAIDKTYQSVFTDEEGYFEISLFPDLLVKIVIPVTGRTVTGTVPYEGRIRFSELY